MRKQKQTAKEKAIAETKKEERQQTTKEIRGWLCHGNDRFSLIELKEFDKKFLGEKEVRI